MPLVAATGDIVVKSILVATDFSGVSDKPLRHALAIARHYGAKVYLAHVVSAQSFTLAGPEAVNAATDAAWRDARQLEKDLLQRGKLAGLNHEVIVLQGNVWEELEKVVQQEQVDLLVVGTHGRRGLGKLLLGSVAENIFRHAGCLVLTVGPGSLQDSPVDGSRAVRPFLFATDFSEASLRALPYAVSSANHFGTKLVLLHVVPAVPTPESVTRPSADDVMQMREQSRVASIQRLKELTLHSPKLIIEPQFVVEFGSPSEEILRTADAVRSDAIILGLHSSTHIDTKSHLPWATAYEVACGACCAVLSVRN